MTVDRVQQAADAITALSGGTPADAKRALTEYPVRDQVAALAVGGGGSPGGTAVSCLLARDTGMDVHDSGEHPILWDALYDNNVSFGTLGAIPDGLGLDFDFDGSSSVITVTEAGVFALTYLFSMSLDDNWSGTLNMGFQSVGLAVKGGTDNEITSPHVAFVGALPAEAALNQRVVTDSQAGNDPYNISLGLVITRIG